MFEEIRETAMMLANSLNQRIMGGMCDEDEWRRAMVNSDEEDLDVARRSLRESLGVVGDPEDDGR